MEKNSPASEGDIRDVGSILGQGTKILQAMHGMAIKEIKKMLCNFSILISHTL